MLQPSSDGDVSGLGGNVAMLVMPKLLDRQQDADGELDALQTASNAGHFDGGIRTIANPMIVRGNPMSVMG